MSLLRRALGVGAVLLLALSVPLVVLPRTVVETVLGQEQVPDAVWIRLFGAGGVALALFHVLVLRKLEDLWWWCWTFVLFNGLVSGIVILHVSTELPEGSAAWPWWALAASTAVFTALYVVGLAKAGQEKPLA
jgi:hypothetical protein